MGEGIGEGEEAAETGGGVDEFGEVGLLGGGGGVVAAPDLLAGGRLDVVFWGW